MPRRNSRDARQNPKARLGEMLAQARENAGFPTQAALAEHLRIDRTVVGKAESGERPPSDSVLEAWIQACRIANVELIATLVDLARGADESDPIPAWFADYLNDVEAVAHTIRTWQPMIVPGLLQTPDYARALFTAMGERPAKVDAQVAARVRRQSVIDRDEPVSLWVVLDDAVLRRHVVSPAVMHEQLAFLAERARLPNVGIQLLPPTAGANAGCVGAVTVASVDGRPDVTVLETVEDTVSDTPRLVRKALGIFDRVRGEALPRGASLDAITEAAKSWER
jgi:transcriptional regulator with XRE-family HTH domain